MSGLNKDAVLGEVATLVGLFDALLASDIQFPVRLMLMYREYCEFQMRDCQQLDSPEVLSNALRTSETVERIWHRLSRGRAIYRGFSVAAAQANVRVARLPGRSGGRRAGQSK